LTTVTGESLVSADLPVSLRLCEQTEAIFLVRLLFILIIVKPARELTGSSKDSTEMLQRAVNYVVASQKLVKICEEVIR
jgi:hypothetical protein